MSEAQSALIEVVAEMTREFDGPPFVAEVVEVVGLVLPDDDRLGAESLKVVPVSKRASRVGQLNDAAFVEASNLLSLLGTDASVGQELLELLRGLPAESLADSAADVRAVELVGRPVRKQPTRGDVVAIPSAHGGFHFAVMLAKNGFGTAYGLFRVRRDAAARPAGLGESNALGYAVYSGDESVLSGRWRVVDHDEALCAFFPSDPEIYHKMGIAETPAGAVRQVPDEELLRVGVSDGSYRQVYSETYLEHALDNGRLLSER